MTATGFLAIAAPPFTAEINIDDNRWEAVPELENILSRCLSRLPKPAANAVSLSILLTDDADIRQLNHRFRNRDGATNVLSFPDGENDCLGDIAVSYDRVDAECHNENKTFADHFAHLVVHGCLHLMGYDHETDEDAQEMELLEIKILRDMNIENPYSDCE